MKTLIREAIRFSLVGIINTSIGLLTIYAVMYFARADPVTANVIGYAVGFAISFMLNRTWTFNSQESALGVLPRFFLCAGVAYLSNLVALVIVHEHLGLDAYLAQLIGVSVSTVVMFIGSRAFVFRVRGPR